ncbi:MAG TPA: CotH kinase family protein, partial [Anaerolineales bacterium]|nr:CotH kinase family protein [Anaerolineales bacterium]
TLVNITSVEDVNNQPIKDNLALYENDDPTSVVCMYVTVRKGNSLENTEYTWEEVNNFDKWTNKGSRAANDVVGQAEVIFQIGDETGPLPGELGYNISVPNGTIQIRGASTSANGNQKSYKIELYDDAGLWRGQSTIALNKHVFDPTRVRNKLSFDLLKGIPGIVTLRTQFVHLYVKDETTSFAGKGFVDYGLFTQVEAVNKAYLRNHQLDPNGQLYKATSFEFYRYEDQIRLESDPLFDESEFSHRLEIKGNRDHSKLIQMLNDINNYDIPIAQTFEKYFNEDNYFTWLAYNILVGNVDTQNQNFYLYSPQNSEKWYFIPWDFDGDLERQKKEELDSDPYLSWEVGLHNYWGGVLHNRLLRLEKYRTMLDNKINELSIAFPADRLRTMLNSYRAVTEPFVFSAPDVKHLSRNKYQYNLSFELIPTEIENNKKLYFETQKYPTPFFLGTPEIIDGELRFTWDQSFSFTPQVITYRFLISKDLLFNNIAFQSDLVESTEISTPVFEPGVYYWRVIAINEEGFNRFPFDAYFGQGFSRYDGMKFFMINQDGTLGDAQ